MRILAVVTARGGSKRVPGKNIRPLAGRPLISWTIDAVRPFSQVCDILVSTDDQAIYEVARAAGAMVPWLRPDELSTDIAPSAPVCIHALDWYEGSQGAVDGLLLLQPTSPFRRRDSLTRGLALYHEMARRTVIGVSPAVSHPQLCFTVDRMAMSPFIPTDGTPVRSQDLPPAYEINGAFYLIAPDNLRRYRSFVHEGSVPLIMDYPEERIDIDTEWDWRMAEAACQDWNPLD